MFAAVIGCGEGVVTGGEVPRNDADGGTVTDGGNDDGGSSNDGGTANDGGSTDGGTEPNPCPNGPLLAPIPNCQVDPPPSTGNEHADCVSYINKFRWECQCLPPFQRRTDAEVCSDAHAEYDSTRYPHAGGYDHICQPSPHSQNECWGWPINNGVNIIGSCLQAMWNEGPGQPFSEHGHYYNMSSTQWTRAACGFYDDGERIWLIQNFWE